MRLVNTEYRRYIDSPEWRKKRLERLKHDGLKCARCESTELLEVHHLTYERLGRERLSDLLTLCHDCHAKDHGRDPDIPAELPESFFRQRFWDEMALERRQEVIGDIVKVVQQLGLMSHAPIQGYNFAPNDVGRGQRWRLRDSRPPVAHLAHHQAKTGDSAIPRGDIDRWGDAQDEFRQKSHVYFERKLSRLLRRGCSEDDLLALLKEAEDALEDWRKTPQVSSIEPPARYSFDWKCAIADDDRPIELVKREYTVSRATIYRYRQTYRHLRRKTS